MAHIRPDYFGKYKTKFENVDLKKIYIYVCVYIYIYIYTHTYIFEGGSTDEMSTEDVKLKP